VIVDLEDGVAPAAKDEARTNLAGLLDREREKPVYVRINSPRTSLAAADCEAIGGLAGVTGIHVPKVVGHADVAAVLARLPVRDEPYRFHCLIESAAGVEAAYDTARGPAVAGISLGEADLRSETGALEEGLDWARSRIVNAAVAAGLPRPPQSVYPRLRDDEGLAQSCRRGRELGHLGRAAIHPEQLAVIERAYLPTAEELERARATVEKLEAAGAGTLETGEFVDAAMLAAAQQALALAERYGTVSG
jgi:citrate lyase subunit beta/citryl-CoA lyase